MLYSKGEGGAHLSRGQVSTDDIQDGLNIPDIKLYVTVRDVFLKHKLIPS